jgi:hypothetical protein
MDAFFVDVGSLLFHRAIFAGSAVETMRAVLKWRHLVVSFVRVFLVVFVKVMALWASAVDVLARFVILVETVEADVHQFVPLYERSA